MKHFKTRFAVDTTVAPEEFGQVTFYDAARKFGFVRPDAPQAADVFIRHDAVDAVSLPLLVPGTRVAFRARENPRKPSQMETTALRILPNLARAA